MNCMRYRPGQGRESDTNLHDMDLDFKQLMVHITNKYAEWLLINIGASSSD